MLSEDLPVKALTASETGDRWYSAPAAAKMERLLGKKPSVAPLIDLGRHLPVLDGLRGVAILMVMLFHFFVGAGGVDAIAASSTVLGSQLSKFISFGTRGVDLFFVLSGFLITGILIDTKESPNFFRNFYARRFLRIFPLYYGVLVGIFLVLPLFSPGLHTPLVAQLWYWFYASNLVFPIPNQQLGVPDVFAIHHFWSLAIEEQFYLVWPLMVFFTNRKIVIRATIGCLLLAPLTRIVLLMTGHDEYVFSFTLSRLDPIAVGALLAVVLRSPTARTRLGKAVPWCLVGAAIAAVVLIVLPRRMELPPVVVVRYSVFAALFGSLLAYILLFGNGVLGWCFRSRILQFFGKYSYGLYVFHLLFLPFFLQRTPLEPLSRAMHSEILGLVARIAILTGASTLIAVASYHLYEKHFLRLKRYFASPRLTSR